MKLRLALLRAAFSRDPERVVLEQSYLLAVERERDMPLHVLPPPAWGTDPAGIRVRCLSSRRYGTVIHDDPALAGEGMIRVLWDGNTGGVYARARYLSVILDRSGAPFINPADLHIVDKLIGPADSRG